MGSFILRRLIQTAAVLVILSVIAFLILQLIPGDPVLTMLGDQASPLQIQTLRHEMGFDQPLPLQYLNWFTGVLQGNFGKSISYREAVAKLIPPRFFVTFHLGLLAFILGTVIGITAGILSAIRHGTIFDSTITFLSTIGMAVPIFWLGILGIYFFALQLRWLPVQGYTSPFEDFARSTRESIMPAICLAVIPMAAMMRLTRSSMLEVVRQDYIRTAYAKGLSEHSVILRHALKNAIIPVITLLGLQLRVLVGGSVLVEQVFNIPGMGSLLVSAVLNKDFAVVQGGILIVGAAVALTNLLIDISYGYLDPRISHAR